MLIKHTVVMNGENEENRFLVEKTGVVFASVQSLLVDSYIVLSTQKDKTRKSLLYGLTKEESMEKALEFAIEAAMLAEKNGENDETVKN